MVPCSALTSLMLHIVDRKKWQHPHHQREDWDTKMVARVKAEGWGLNCEDIHHWTCEGVEGSQDRKSAMEEKQKLGIVMTSVQVPKEVKRNSPLFCFSLLFFMSRWPVSTENACICWSSDSSHTEDYLGRKWTEVACYPRQRKKENQAASGMETWLRR